MEKQILVEQHFPLVRLTEAAALSDRILSFQPIKKLARYASTNQITACNESASGTPVRNLLPWWKLCVRYYLVYLLISIS